MESESGTASRSEAWFIILAVIALGAGLVVYSVDRTHSAYFLPDAFRAQHAVGVFGALAHNLPSFVHTFGFSLLLAAALWPWPRYVRPALLLWVGVEVAFECVQARPLADLLYGSLPQSVDTNAGVRVLKIYLLNGTFDLNDVLSALVGGACALVVVEVNKGRGKCL